MRALYLDRSPGEARGVVTLGGKPERLLIERPGDPAAEALGAVSVARVRRIERGLGLAFLELDGGEAAAPMAGLVQGRAVEVEVTVEARRGKACAVRILGPAEGEPRLLRAAPALAERLAAFAPGPIIEGPAAREAADQAEATALAVHHPLPGGGSIAIEPTQALTAIDVDTGARGGGDARRAARQTNLAAIAEAARLLRLKGLGGLVVFDLVGKGHDGAAMSAAAKAAFEAGVSIGPISRFGLFELSIPRASTPVAERLAGPDGRPTALTCALRMLRALDREGRADPGGRLVSHCAPDVADAATPYTGAMTDLLGARFSIRPDPALAYEAFTVGAA